MYLITNGRIITETEILENHDLLLTGDRIEAIVERGTRPLEDCQVIDAGGGYIAPGFIDIHSDFIETMAAPRPTCLVDFSISLRETEKILLHHGITTMFHSLSFYQNHEFDHRPIRNRENALKLVELICEIGDGPSLIRHRFHARLEIDCLEQADLLASHLSQGKIHLLSFMDHTPGQGQYRDLTLYRKILRGYRQWSEPELDRLIAEKMEKKKLTLEKMQQLASLALEQDIAVASHDDDSLEKLQLARSFGTQISEFPITLEVAAQAKAMGMYTMAGAPNVLLGGSHTGNLSAAEGIREGVIDMLCSDYYPASLLHAVFTMHENHGIPLPEMLRLVTLHPARAVHLDHLLGSIQPGKKADLLIIKKLPQGLPVIGGVFVDGRMKSSIQYEA